MMDVTKCYRITEDDLSLLERVLPLLQDNLKVQCFQDPELSVALDEAKRIMSDVRWNYGP